MFDLIPNEFAIGEVYLPPLLICGVLTWQGVQVPEFVWAALAAFGLGFLRAGVQKTKPEE